MNIGKKNKYGGIDISEEAIAQVAGKAAEQCYGVIGLGPKPSIKIKKLIKQILKAEDFHKGIYVNKVGRSYEVSIYLYLVYGVRITEVVSSVQKKVKFDLERAFNTKFSAVNVFVLDVKEI